jgi:hypothetical protein
MKICKVNNISGQSMPYLVSATACYSFILIPSTQTFCVLVTVSMGSFPKPVYAFVASFF